MPTDAIQQTRTIDWKLLEARRPAMLKNIGKKDHSYLILPEVGKLIEAAIHLQTRVAIVIMWYTGIRIGELLALRVDDFYRAETNYGFIEVKRTLKKRGKVVPRAIEIHDAWCLDLIKQYVGTAQLTQRHCLFPGKQSKSKAISPSTVFRRIETLANQCKFEIKVTPHTLRHSFAINALLHGRPIKTLQVWLGHSDPRSTEVYAKILAGDVGFQMEGIQYRKASI
jgi:integrase